jgi:NAD(P)-dependent dehydrogenase (short-subunit alcohol dehydrogenase family)
MGVAGERAACWYCRLQPRPALDQQAGWQASPTNPTDATNRPTRAADKINVNVVLPGAVNTPFTTRVLVGARPLSPVSLLFPCWSTRIHLASPPHSQCHLRPPPIPPIPQPPTPNPQTDPTKLAYILQRIPLARLAEPEDIVGPILFLSSRAADYCTGSALVVDGGGTSRAMAQ